MMGETGQIMDADLPELRGQLARLLLARHDDARSLVSIRAQMKVRQKEIGVVSEQIEDLEDDLPVQVSAVAPRPPPASFMNYCRAALPARCPNRRQHGTLAARALPTPSGASAASIRGQTTPPPQRRR